jgi:hypothetical protein
MAMSSLLPVQSIATGGRNQQLHNMETKPLELEKPFVSQRERQQRTVPLVCHCLPGLLLLFAGATANSY